MPREESAALQELEDEGAAEAVEETVEELTSAYMDYLAMLRQRLGNQDPVSDAVRERLKLSVREQLEMTG